MLAIYMIFSFKLARKKYQRKITIKPNIKSKKKNSPQILLYNPYTLQGCSILVFAKECVFFKNSFAFNFFLEIVWIFYESVLYWYFDIKVVISQNCLIFTPVCHHLRKIQTCTTCVLWWADQKR